MHSLCTLHATSYPVPAQHSVPPRITVRGWPGGGGYPLGSTERFPLPLLNPSPHVASPFPRLGLAHWKASAVATLVAGTRDPAVLRLLAETVLRPARFTLPERSPRDRHGAAPRMVRLAVKITTETGLSPGEIISASRRSAAVTIGGRPVRRATCE